MAQLSSRHLFKVNLEVAPAQAIGPVPVGFNRRFVAVTGGTFQGDRIKGRVLAGGADTIVVRPDGGAQLDVRLVLETDQGELVYMTYAGKKVPASDAQPEYFRVSVLFETASERLGWLNNLIAVGMGSREGNGPAYEVFEIT